VVALTETVSVSEAMVPDEGVTVIQGAFSVAVHVLSLVRLDESTTVCGDGSLPPVVAEKVRAPGLTCKAHDGFTKPRSIANVNMVLPSTLDIVCRIGAVRESWISILIVLNGLCPISLNSVSPERWHRRWLGRYRAMPVPGRIVSPGKQTPCWDWAREGLQAQTDSWSDLDGRRVQHAESAVARFVMTSVEPSVDEKSKTVFRLIVLR